MAGCGWQESHCCCVPFFYRFFCGPEKKHERSSIYCGLQYILPCTTMGAGRSSQSITTALQSYRDFTAPDRDTSRLHFYMALHVRHTLVKHVSCVLLDIWQGLTYQRIITTVDCRVRISTLDFTINSVNTAACAVQATETINSVQLQCVGYVQLQCVGYVCLPDLLDRTIHCNPDGSVTGCQLRTSLLRCSGLSYADHEVPADIYKTSAVTPELQGFSD